MNTAQGRVSIYIIIFLFAVALVGMPLLVIVGSMIQDVANALGVFYFIP